MNSSGIKRGLAATAVAALAVTGLPFLASSASAVSGDELTFVGAGPTRDSVAPAAIGGYVVLKAKGVANLADAQARLTVIDDDLSGTANDANQTVELNTAGIQFAADGPTNLFGGADGYSEIYAPVKVDTSVTGATATYALFLDDDDAVAPAGGNGTVEASEARVVVNQATAGAPTTITVDPASQTAPAGVQSGGYVGTVKDSAGRTTQLLGAGESINIQADAGETIQRIADLNQDGTNDFAEGADGADQTVSGAETAQRGQFTFKARSSATTLHSIEIDGPSTADTTVNLDVVAAAGAITPQQVDIVTGADDRNGFGKASTTVNVRPDQTAVKFDIASTTTAPAPTNGNTTVSATITSAAAPNAVTFGGASSTTQTVKLDASAKGSFTVNVDAASIQSGDSFTVAFGGQTYTVTYAAPAVTAAGIATDAATYVSAFGGTINPTVTVKDQYGNPVTGVYVTVDVEGPTNGASSPETARKAVDANGQATFALTDTKATAGSHADDHLVVKVYPGQFGAALQTIDPAATIVYSANGQGANFNLQVDGVTPAGSAYDPNTVNPITPLTDTVADNAAEYTVLSILGATTGAPVTVTVDNGALVLNDADGETKLSQASASDSSSITGAADTQFRIIGTKTGLVNVTVTSAGVTKTAVIAVHTSSEANPPVSAAGTARNLAVTGPEKAEAGDTVNFTVKVTDAFGNPVYGVTSGSLVTAITGPAQVLGASSATTNAAGEIVYQVKILDSADSPVTLQVTGSGNQFGAAADHLAANDGANATGAGLTKSENVDSASIAKVVNIEALEQAVADAQAKVDTATDNLDAAKGDLTVAKAERSVAQKAVKQAKKELRQAKKSHKGVKAARKALAEARGDLRIAKAKVSAAQSKVNTAMTRLEAAQAELEAAQQALEDAQK